MALSFIGSKLINCKVSNELCEKDGGDSDTDNDCKEHKKESKLYIVAAIYSTFFVNLKKIFINPPVLVAASPAIDHHTPPPDSFYLL